MKSLGGLALVSIQTKPATVSCRMKSGSRVCIWASEKTVTFKGHIILFTLKGHIIFDTQTNTHSIMSRVLQYHERHLKLWADLLDY